MASRITPIGWLHLNTGQLNTGQLNTGQLNTVSCQRTLRIAWRRDAYLSAAARQFRDFAVSHFARQPALD